MPIFLPIAETSSAVIVVSPCSLAYVSIAHLHDLALDLTRGDMAMKVGGVALDLAEYNELCILGLGGWFHCRNLVRIQRSELVEDLRDHPYIHLCQAYVSRLLLDRALCDVLHGIGHLRECLRGIVRSREG
jgi:hypothetical protein